MNTNIKTDNGWYHINDVKPNNEEEVLVILERESKIGVTYDFTIIESTYRPGYFLGENDAWKVRYWRRRELIPYPDGVVRREIEECRKYNVNPRRVIEHQKMCGIEIGDGLYTE